VEESKDIAKKEGDRLILAAKAQIEQEKQQAIEGLRKEVAALALRAAEQILSAEIDKAKHQDIVSKVSNQLVKHNERTGNIGKALRVGSV